MTLGEATAILSDAIEDDGGLSFNNGSEYIIWNTGDGTVVLDGRFTTTKLAAIAVYVEASRHYL